MTKNTKDCPNPSSSFEKAIDKIIEDDLLEIYNLLKKYFDNLGFLMKTDRKTVIHDIICKRNYEMFGNMIRDGVDINIRDSSGNFPIHIAAQIGDDSILSHLLRNNASVNATSHAHQTALYLAAKNGHKIHLTLSNSMVLKILLTDLVKLLKITQERMEITINFMLIITTNIFLCTVKRSKKIATVGD